MLVLVVSYRFRRKLTMPIWRRLHYTSYIAFTFATLHGIFSGSSTKTTWMQAIYIGAIALVLGATVFRVLSPAPPKKVAAAPDARRPAPAPTAAPATLRSARRHESQPHHTHTATRRHEVPAASASK
jgi:DMSO/TMAO reductase YedYZ heme-binding membrane subunit